MYIRKLFLVLIALGLGVLLNACANPNPPVSDLTPIPSLIPGSTPTLVPALQSLPASGLVSAPVSEEEDSAALGAHIYLINCSPCHGNQGQGVDAPPLRNSEYILSGGDQNVFDTIARGRTETEMPAWLIQNGGSMSESQISDVLAYLHTLQDVPSVPPSPLDEEQEPTPTPLPPNAPTPEPARPSNPGEAGQAASMAGDIGNGQEYFGLYCSACHGPEGVQGIPNPGSDDGSVPVLNPIDSTIVDPSADIFAVNVDLFIEHGSVPEGEVPRLVMPSFGDSHMLSQEQIADLIAYIMSLNGVERTK